MNTTPAAIFPVDMVAALAAPDRCIVCGRKVSAKTLDKGKATMIKVDETGNRTEEANAFRVVVGPECASKTR